MVHGNEARGRRKLALWRRGFLLEDEGDLSVAEIEIVGGFRGQADRGFVCLAKLLVDQGFEEPVLELLDVLDIPGARVGPGLQDRQVPAAARELFVRG